MTETKLFDAHGHRATGIPAIACPSWCTNPGHIAETSRDDQNCYSADGENDVKCSLSVEVSKYGAAYSVVGAWAYRRFHHLPVVQLYVRGFEPDIDRTFELTGEEARQLGVHLLAAADLLVG